MRLAIFFALVAPLVVSSVGRTDESAPLPTAHSKTNPDCKACDKSNDCAITGVERLEHLLEAVHHLETAGMQKEADQVRRQMDGEIEAVIRRLKQTDAQRSFQAPPESSTKQISIQFQLVEVDLTKLRNLGVDFAALGKDKKLPFAEIVKGVRVKNDITNAENAKAFFRALCNENLAKVLAEPQIVTLSGKPIRFVSGGEAFPLTLPQGSRGKGEDSLFFGNRIEAVAEITSQGKILTSFRFELTQLDPHQDTLPMNLKTLSTRTRLVDATIELATGQAAVATVGVEEIPVSSGTDNKTEPHDIAMLLLVHPEIAEPLDCAKSDSAKQISVQCEMFEVHSRFLRESGIQLPLTPHVLDADDAKECLDQLLAKNITKRLGEPHVFTHDGKLMHYVNGREIRQGNHKIGTRIGILPRLTEKESIHLEVSAEVDIDTDQAERCDDNPFFPVLAHRVQTEFDLQDGQVAILESPIHRQTLEEAYRIEGPFGVVLKHQNVAVDMLRLIVVRPSIEQPSK